MKKIWVCGYSTNKYPFMLKQNDYRVGDGYDEFRNTSKTFPVIFNSMEMFFDFITNKGKDQIDIIKITRTINRKNTKRILESGNCVCFPVAEIIFKNQDGVISMITINIGNV